MLLGVFCVSVLTHLPFCARVSVGLGMGWLCVCNPRAFPYSEVWTVILRDPFLNQVLIEMGVVTFEGRISTLFFP